MKKTFLIAFLFVSAQIFAQTSLHTDNLVNEGGSRIMEIKAAPVANKGSVYYNDNWVYGSFKLFSGELFSNIELRYNIKTQKLETLENRIIRKISIGSISECTIGNRQLINCTNFKSNEATTGFYIVLAGDKTKLLKHIDLILLDSNYNPALDIGSRARTYSKTKKYFVEKDNKVTAIKLRKRKVLKLFKDKAPDIEEFAKRNKLKYRSESDLSKIINFYNTL